jgi:putative ABC transport system permease protein
MNGFRLPRLGPRARISWRYLRGHLWQAALMVLGIALGVAVMVGVDLANQSAARAFDLSTESLTGRTTHILSGGSAGLEDQVYIDLVRSGWAHPAAPVITAYVTSPQLDGLTLQLLGLDPFAEPPFRDYLTLDRADAGETLTLLLTTPGGVLLSQELADRFDLAPGSELELVYSGESRPARVVGLLEVEDELDRRALSQTLLADLASAQELTGRLGRLDRVDLILPEEAGSTAAELQERVPEGVRVLPAGARTGIVKEMTSAFQVNLTALSLLAMVVAVFLIYNTMTFSVTQRRALFGTLRGLGMTRREIFGMVLWEALAAGALGSLLGIALGIAMGRGTVALVTRTINDLFFVTTVRELPLPLVSLVKGVLVGVGGTLLAAVFPAREAVTIPPRSALVRSTQESRARRLIPWAAAAGLVFELVGVRLLAVPTRDLTVSFGATFVIVLGLALLTPQLTRWLMAGVSALVRRGPAVARMAPREVAGGLSRTSVAVAALMIAVSVTIGVSLMVTSFRSTVITWLDQILQGDVYVSVPGASVSQPSYPIRPEVIEILEGWEGVSRVDVLQTARVNSPQGPVELSASGNPQDGLEQIYRSTAVPREQIQGRLEAGAVLVSEPLANRLDLFGPDQVLPLYTDRGLVEFPVVGVYYDYSSTEGNALLTLDVYREYWDDRRVTAASLTLAEGRDPEAVSRELEGRLGEVQNLLIRPNRELRRETLAIFDRTFTITGTLQAMTTAVAFVGVLSAMMSLQLEKGRQFGVLRSIGMSGRQLWALVLGETGLIGLASGLMAVPTGYVLALILIYVINRRSFGWTLLLEVRPGPFGQAVLIALGASLLAGIYPAWRIMQRSAAEAVRFE